MNRDAETRTHRTLEAIQIEYLRTHPDEIEPFIEEAFEEFTEEGDTAVLLTLLRVVRGL